VENKSEMAEFGESAFEWQDMQLCSEVKVCCRWWWFGACRGGKGKESPSNYS